jgi:hypothetical protein
MKILTVHLCHVRLMHEKEGGNHNQVQGVAGTCSCFSHRYVQTMMKTTVALHEMKHPLFSATVQKHPLSAGKAAAMLSLLTVRHPKYQFSSQNKLPQSQPHVWFRGRVQLASPREQ